MWLFHGTGGQWRCYFETSALVYSDPTGLEKKMMREEYDNLLLWGL
jgi:hypothetical protein